MTVRIYVRASTKDQDATRALADLVIFSKSYDDNVVNDMLIDLLATMAKLDNDKRRERIKQGLAKSCYKPTGKKPNTTKHNRIRELASQNNMTKEEIAKAVGVGVATVYRVLKQC